MATAMLGGLLDWQWPVCLLGKARPQQAARRPEVARCFEVFGSGSGSVSVTRCQWQRHPAEPACPEFNKFKMMVRAPYTAQSAPQQPNRVVPWAKQELHSEHNPEGSIKQGKVSANIPFSPFFSGFLLVEHASLDTR